MSPLFKGAATALITPFCGGEIDYASLADIIEYQIAEKIDALVVCGTTGESATLTLEERSKVVRFCVDVADKRVPVIAGSGSNSTHRSISLSQDAEACGADGLLVVTPYYNKASRVGIIEHYREIARAVSIPILVYNVPSRTGLCVSPEVYSELMCEDNIVGAKEACGNMQSVTMTLALSPNAQIYSGNDADAIPIMSVGGLGVISVVSNILPRLVHDMCADFLGGNPNSAAEVQRRLCPLSESLFSEVNPIPIKYAMSLLGFCENELRLPLTPLTEALQEKVRADMTPFFPSL